MCVCWLIRAKDWRLFMRTWLFLIPPTGVSAPWLYTPCALSGECVCALSHEVFIPCSREDLAALLGHRLEIRRMELKGAAELVEICSNEMRWGAHQLVSRGQAIWSLQTPDSVAQSPRLRRHFTSVSLSHIHTHSALLLIGTRRLHSRSLVPSHVHVWAKLACLTQLCSISGVYCHADTIPLMHMHSCRHIHTHIYICTHIHALVADSCWASCLSSLQGKSWQPRWSQISVPVRLWETELARVTGSSQSICIYAPIKPIRHFWSPLLSSEKSCLHLHNQTCSNKLDRQIEMSRRALNANAENPNKLLWSVFASCSSNLELRSEQFTDNSTHTNTPPCLFLLAVSLPADHPVGRICVFIKPDNTNTMHANTQTLCICISSIGCLGNTEHAALLAFKVRMLVTLTVMCAGSLIGS